ncbi:NYN domain-containing protein [Litoreibacter sp.]|nr:NYN domain-containing protein [Litoreibacter sp.]
MADYPAHKRGREPIYSEPCFAFLDAENIFRGFRDLLTKRGVRDEDFGLFSIKRLIVEQLHDRTYVYSALQEEDTPSGWLGELEQTGRFVLRTGRLTKKKGATKKQEGVDVKLSLDAIKHALGKTMSSCWIYSGDGDFIPLIEALVETGVTVSVVGFGNPDLGEVTPKLRASADHYMRIDGQHIWATALIQERRFLSSGGLAKDTNPPFEIEASKHNEVEILDRKATVYWHEGKIYFFYCPVDSMQLKFHIFGSLENFDLWFRLAGVEAFKDTKMDFETARKLAFLE